MSESNRLDLEVTAIVIAYNAETRIADAITSHTEALAHVPAEILIVDNASSDRTVAIARDSLQRGRVVANKENLGYGKAVNLAVRQARGRKCIILNDDAKLTAEAVDRLLEVIDSDPKIALVGPKIVGEDGKPMPSARVVFPGPEEEISRIKDKFASINRDYIYPTEGDEPIDVAWLLGACIMGDTQTLIEVGGFNPAFFLYGEDIDLCRRVVELGYRVLTVPDALCTHTGSVSTSTAWSAEERLRRQSDGRALYYRIWYRRPTRFLIHLRRAIGRNPQPWLLKYNLPKALNDGGSLAHLRYPTPLDTSREDQ